MARKPTYRFTSRYLNHRIALGMFWPKKDMQFADFRQGHWRTTSKRKADRLQQIIENARQLSQIVQY